MLHDKPPGEDDPELAAWDMHAEMTREAEKNLNHSLAPELEGLAIRGMLVGASPLSSGMNFNVAQPVHWSRQTRVILHVTMM